MANNFYDLLEVNKSASQEAIAASYKRLHSKLADQAGAGNEDATNSLIALRESYQTLSEPERRRRYDERLEARQGEQQLADREPFSFVKLLVIVSVIGLCGVGYGKFQSDQEKARLERDKAVAIAKIAEVEARKEREDREASDQAERKRLSDEATERYNRERDLAYGNQVSRELQRSETQLRIDRERAEQQRSSATRQQQYEAERQLAKDKAYLRQLEAENSRYRR